MGQAQGHPRHGAIRRQRFPYRIHLTTPNNTNTTSGSLYFRAGQRGRDSLVALGLADRKQ